MGIASGEGEPSLSKVKIELLWEQARKCVNYGASHLENGGEGWADGLKKSGGRSLRGYAVSIKRRQARKNVRGSRRSVQRSSWSC